MSEEPLELNTEQPSAPADRSLRARARARRKAFAAKVRDDPKDAAKDLGRDAYLVKNAWESTEGPRQALWEFAKAAVGLG